MKTKTDYKQAIDEFISALAAEQKADNKAFYNLNDGSQRAQTAIAVLDAARERLQPFVRA